MQQTVNIGAVANDGTGDALRDAFDKLNQNDAELYAWIASGGMTGAQVLAALLPVDGSGSGLDADLLDGMHATDFALATHTHVIADVSGLQAALDTKLPSASYTAADVLSKLLSVDGAGSGLDADLLDGMSSAAFAAASHAHAQSDITGLTAALALKLNASAYTAADVVAKLLTVDGSGSGVDADLLDGQHANAFAAASHSHAIADVTGLQTALDGKGDLSSAASISVDSEVMLYSGTTGKLAKRATGSGLATLTLGVLSLTDPATFATAAHTHAQADVTGLTAALAAKLDSTSYTAADVLSKLLTVDGTGSGLDADLLDGNSAAAFAAASHTHAIADVTGLQDALDAYTAADVLAKLLTVDGTGSGIDADLLDGQSAAAFAAASHTHAQGDVTGLTASLAAKLDASSYTAADVLSKLLTVDGTGSGLDADLLDGQSSAAFAAASHAHAQSDVTGLVAALTAKLDSSSYTAADVLAKLLTVDGSSSGLDADLLDGISSAGFLQTSNYEALTPTWTAAHTFNLTPTVPNQSWTYAKLQNVSATARVLGRATAGAGVVEELTGSQLATIVGYSAADVLSKLLTVDGTGSGLDADLLDGISSAGFLQASTYEALTPTWTALHTHTANVLYTSANPRIRILETGLASDTGGWDFNWDAGTLAIRTRTDADAAGISVLTITRPSGTQPLRLFAGGVDADLSGFSTTAGNINNYTVVFSAFDITRNANFALVSTQRPLFNFIKYGGAFSSLTQIPTNTALHQISFSCYNTDTAAIATCCAISCTSTEAWGSSAQGARMDLAVTPNGTTSRVTVLRLAESQIQSLDGTALLPSRTYQSDPDTGDYRIAANQYGISCGGTLVLDIATALFAITATTVRFNTTTATTIGAAGGAAALPATPLGYMTVNVGGTAAKIPYYNT